MRFEQEDGPVERVQSGQTSKDVVAAVALRTEEVQKELLVATEPVGLELHENEAFLLMALVEDLVGLEIEVERMQ